MFCIYCGNKLEPGEACNCEEARKERLRFEGNKSFFDNEFKEEYHEPEVSEQELGREDTYPKGFTPSEYYHKEPLEQENPYYEDFETKLKQQKKEKKKNKAKSKAITVIALLAATSIIGSIGSTISSHKTNNTINYTYTYDSNYDPNEGYYVDSEKGIRVKKEETAYLEFSEYSVDSYDIEDNTFIYPWSNVKFEIPEGFEIANAKDTQAMRDTDKAFDCVFFAENSEGEYIRILARESAGYHTIDNMVSTVMFDIVIDENNYFRDEDSNVSKDYSYDFGEECEDITIADTSYYSSEIRVGRREKYMIAGKRINNGAFIIIVHANSETNEQNLLDLFECYEPFLNDHF